MKRAVPLVAGVVLIAIGGLGAISGGALMAVFGSSNTLRSGTQPLQTTSTALVSQVTRVQNTRGVAETLGRAVIRFRASARDSGPGVFVGIGPAAAVDHYLAGAAVDQVTDLTLNPFRLSVIRHGGTSTPPPPARQSFWVAQESGSHADLNWTITDGAYRLVVMNADGSRGVQVTAQVAVTVPHLFSIGLGILIAGLVAALIGLVLLIAGLRTRRRPHAFASSTAGSAGPPADL